jgi:hypothetical protein
VIQLFAMMLQFADLLVRISPKQVAAVGAFPEVSCLFVREQIPFVYNIK